MRKTFKVAVFILFVLITLGQIAHAQDNSKKPSHLRESQRKAMRSRDSVMRALSKSDTSINSLLQRLEQYTTSFNQVNNNLASGLDTTDVGQQFPSAIKRINRIKNLASTHKSSTLRYLFVLRDNLDHLQGQVEDWQSDLDDMGTKLVQNQTDLIKFSKDSILKESPTDSALKSAFDLKRKTAIVLWRKTDLANRTALFKVNLLQDKVATLYTNILDETDQIDTKIKRFAVRSLTGEFDYIWTVDPQYNDFKSALNGTVNLNNTQLYYFFKNETLTHLAGIIFLVIVFIWILYNRAKTFRNNENPEAILNEASYIYKLPFVSCLLIVIAIAPYFYDHPPVIFLEACFLVSLVCVLIIIKKFCPKALFNALQVLFVLTIGYSISNLLIEVTNVDRYAVLALSLLSIIAGLAFYKKVKQIPEDYLPHTATALQVFIVMQLLSLLCNISGRFSLAKIISVTAVYNLWFLVTLYFVVQIIIQGLFLQFQTPKEENSIVSWIDYNLLQKKFRNILATLAGILWFFFLLQNFNIDDFVTDYVGDVLNQSRTVAGASFTVGGFVIFIAVIWLSSVLSRIVSYFYDVAAQRSNDLSSQKKKNRTSTLLIRIGVFTIGFFLAVAASNFPLDKITIIISAFGVGIGFGLQNVVNNLVSGLILAFEKPIQIGDIIEVDNRSGTIKEIGIRSSKLATADGAEVIIPNGDLISHHVINWTLSNNNRRVEIIVSVAYGSDIPRVKQLLSDLLHNRDDVMAQPEPLIFIHNLNENSVDFRLLFWAADIGTWLQLKSHILVDVYELFTKEGVELPSHKQDVNVTLLEGKQLDTLEKESDDKTVKDQQKSS